MGKIYIKIDWCDNNYAASPENEEVTCVATGKTLTEVKKNIQEAIELQLAGMLEDGVKIPAEFLGEREYEYHMTDRAQALQ